MSLTEYLATLASPMQRANVHATLTTKVLYNGTEVIRRHELIERKVCEAGATVAIVNGEPGLMDGEGRWMDKRAITQRGLDYARWLIANRAFWSYQPGERTPTVDDLPPGAFAGTQDEFEGLSPGMRREINRTARKLGGAR